MVVTHVQKAAVLMQQDAKVKQESEHINCNVIIGRSKCVYFNQSNNHYSIINNDEERDQNTKLCAVLVSEVDISHRDGPLVKASITYIFYIMTMWKAFLTIYSSSFFFYPEFLVLKIISRS